MQQTSITAAQGATTLMNFSYNYGTSTTNTGRVLSRTDAIQPEHSVSYSYDSIYRLSQVVSNDASTSWGTTWSFDIWGNRLTQTPQGLATSKIGTQTLGYTNNRLTTNTYDAAGNQTNDGLHNYTFNAENQITQMDAGAATYAYDGQGRRMKKTVGSETTYYFYGVGGLLCEFTTTNTGATQASSTDRTTYRTSDKLGSAVLILNASGSVIENNRTLPYGEPWLPEVASTNDKKFTTYQRDSESNLDYAMDRYYANTMGRLSSVDKGRMFTWAPLTLNRYVYTGNDPVNHSDRSGSEWFICVQFGEVEIGASFACYPNPFDPFGSGLGTTGAVQPAFSEEEMYPAARNIDKDKLIAGVKGLLSKKDCGDFVVDILQKAFLDVNEVASVDQLGAFEREAYNKLTADAVIQSLTNATLVDGGTELPNIINGQRYETLARVGYVTSSVKFFNGFFAQGATGQAQTALHEGMHLQWNMGDMNFAKAAGVHKAGMQGSEASAAWDAKLREKCK